jgi:hypothetical protein
MPTDGGLRRCSCGAYFLLKNTFNVGFENERTTPSAEFVKDIDLALLLGEQLSKDVEIVVRRRYWRLLNDPYRDIYREHREKENNKNKKRNSFFSLFLLSFGLRKPLKKDELEFTVPKFFISKQLSQNLEELLTLLKNEEIKDYLEITEILRELSRFEEASEMLAKFSEEKNKIADLLKQLLVQKDNSPYRYRM